MKTYPVHRDLLFYQGHRINKCLCPGHMSGSHKSLDRQAHTLHHGTGNPSNHPDSALKQTYMYYTGMRINTKKL